MPKSKTINVLGQVISSPKQFANEWSRTKQALAQSKIDLSESQQRVAYLEGCMAEWRLTQQALAQTQKDLAEAQQRIDYLEERMADSDRRLVTAPRSIVIKRKRLEILPNYPWPAVSRTVSEKDTMLVEGGDGHYLAVGVSAMENISFAIKASSLSKISSILDMPCGHGRVTRVLRAVFPDVEISVCDIDEDGVTFCAAEFNASPLVSGPDFRTLNLGKSFDLIWVGSLITHLPERATAAFFAFVLRHLGPHGIAVVSSHGSCVFDRIKAGSTYGLGESSIHPVLDGYSKSGYGYADYPGAEPQGYGISVISRRWVEKSIMAAGGKLIVYLDQAWDRHHDIIAFGNG